MNLAERIEREKKKNDRLAREIADLRGQAPGLILAAESRGLRERGSAVRGAVSQVELLLGEPFRERIRQKKESDERLAALTRENQEREDENGSKEAKH